MTSPRYAAACLTKPSTMPWPRRTYLELGAVPTAPSCARGHVRTVLLEWGLSGLSDTAELITSELVTNAVRASDGLNPGVAPVRLWLVRDRTSIVMHVWDGSDSMPVRQPPDPDLESGRGLAVVENLSSDWGAYRESAGKVVWARVSV